MLCGQVRQGGNGEKLEDWGGAGETWIKEHDWGKYVKPYIKVGRDRPLQKGGCPF